MVANLIKNLRVLSETPAFFAVQKYPLTSPYPEPEEADMTLHILPRAISCNVIIQSTSVFLLYRLFI
jgi:hypothetical protein